MAKAQYKAYVYDNPYCLFKMQADQVVSAIAATDVGKNVQIVAAPSGSSTTHKSGLVADSSTVATGNAGFPLQVLGSADADLSYSAIGTTMSILVKINTHQRGIATGNAGI